MVSIVWSDMLQKQKNAIKFSLSPETFQHQSTLGKQGLMSSKIFFKFSRNLCPETCLQISLSNQTSV